MSSAIQSSGESVSVAEKVLFKFHDLEITRNTLVIRFFEERTVIALKEIAAYHLKWYLHDPTFAKKYWFLVLTVGLKNGEEKSGPIAVAKFNYVNDEHELQQHIQSKVSLTGDSTERVDTRVLQIIYSFDRGNLPIYVGQQMDVYIDASLEHNRELSAFGATSSPAH